LEPIIGGSKIGDATNSAEHCIDGLPNYTLDRIHIDGMMNVYCECGRIVWLDRSEMFLKLSIGKKLECTHCRNRRISEDIDSLNRHFSDEGPVAEF
jgi:hypothetical protein